jgi:hypothetical protein
MGDFADLPLDDYDQAPPDGDDGANLPPDQELEDDG